MSTRILNCPKDLLRWFVATYASKYVLPLRLTCKAFHAICQRTFDAYQRAVFVERFGAIAEREKTTPTSTLIHRVKNSLSLYDQLQDLGCWLNDIIPSSVEQAPAEVFSHIKNLWLQVTDQGPQLVSHPSQSLPLQTLLDTQDKITSEFAKKPLDPSCPLQDLRDRILRLLFFNQERICLALAQRIDRKSNKDSVSLIKKIMSLVMSQTTLQGESISPLPWSGTLSLNTPGPILGQTTLFFKSQAIPVEIIGHLDLLNDHTFKTSIEFQILRKSNKTLIGSFKIGRAFAQSHSTFYYLEQSLATLTPQQRKTLVSSRLLMFEIYDHLHIDPTNGNRPVEVLIAQLAAALLQREPQRELVIMGQHSPEVFIAAGFTPTLPPQGYLQRIRHEIEKVQRNDRQFPPYLFLDCGDLILRKNSANQLITREEDGTEHAIPFNDYSLLNNQGPILPKFFIHNLNRK